MKTTTFRNTIITLLATITPALAASSREDHSGLIVWIFLGFCSLIVLLQLVPAILMLLGIAKGLGKASVGEEAEAHSSER
jgi:hypothetical protein